MLQWSENIHWRYDRQEMEAMLPKRTGLKKLQIIENYNTL